MKKSFVFYAVLMLAAVLYVNTVRASLAGSIGCASGRLVEISDEALRRIDDLFARRIKAIGDTPNMSVPEGAPRRYLSPTGDDAADGLTPQTAWRTIERLNRETLEAGDFVLFERGGLFRGGRPLRKRCAPRGCSRAGRTGRFDCDERGRSRRSGFWQASVRLA